MIELVIVLACAGAVIAWWHLMQGRQRARAAAGRVCSSHGLQLLDDTVALDSVTWRRHGQRARFQVSYGFEFATDGAQRRSGLAMISAPGAVTVTLDMVEGKLIEQVP